MKSKTSTSTRVREKHNLEQASLGRILQLGVVVVLPSLFTTSCYKARQVERSVTGREMLLLADSEQGRNALQSRGCCSARCDSPGEGAYND